ncbi:ABC transporter ATP-binding protein [Desulfonatronum thioautotrophicum]|uniref:ABC transporter ATP-binding protein n=1 Tax=Desulfonatronum thioautotrophicum TaxID=617001 RepID=UPI0005EB0B0C|nr:energy-coupling factor ABC transporter ATP-binding protein [Desulfonatronum thioautotrophicum]
MFEFIDVQYENILELPHLVIGTEQVTSLVGASGSGKTTVLRLLNKMISPTSGRILFQGEDLGQRDSVRHRRDVVMLSQNPAIFEGTVGDNLRAGPRFQEKEPPGDETLKPLLEQVRLVKALDEPADKLSGGERQRLALARVLLLKPRVYLLDEPSSALDEETEQLIFDMLTAHVRSTGTTIIMVTHSRAVARKYSDTIISMSAGKCVERGAVRA